MDNKTISERIEKYYEEIIEALKTNKFFKTVMTDPKASSNILYLSSINISNILINEIDFKNLDKSMHESYRKNIEQICVEKHRGFFIKNLIKNGILIKNSLIEDKNAINQVSRFIRGEEYLLEKQFKDELFALKNLFDNSNSEILKKQIGKAIELVYQGAFHSGSMYSKIKEGYFIKNEKEIYDNFTNDKKYWLFVPKEMNNYYPDFIKRNFNELYIKEKIINMKQNFEKKYMITTFLEEVKNKKELMDKQYPNNKYILKFIKEYFCNQLYLYASKESTEVQSQYIQLLLPLMEKKRETGLSLLKSEFTRNIKQEKELEKKDEDEDKVSLLIEFKKSNNKITELLSMNTNIEHIEGLPISIQKLNDKTYSFGIILGDKKHLNNDDIIDLKEKFREILLNKCDQTLREEENKKYDTLVELSFIFAKELRAKQIQSQLSESNKQNKIKNKI